MSDSQRAPGASPAEGQVSEQEGSNATNAGGLPDVVASQQVNKLRAEAAKYRTERNELRDRLKALEAADAQRKAEREKAEQAKLEEQGQFKTLLEKERAEVARLQGVIKSAHGQIINGELRARLAAAGVTDAKQQGLLMPALRESVAATVGDDFSVEGNFDAAISELVDVFGFGQAPKTEAAESNAETATAQSLNPAALLLSQALPNGASGSAAASIDDQFRASLTRVLS